MDNEQHFDSEEDAFQDALARAFFNNDEEKVKGFKNFVKITKEIEKLPSEEKKMLLAALTGDDDITAWDISKQLTAKLEMDKMKAKVEGFHGTLNEVLTKLTADSDEDDEPSKDDSDKEFEEFLKEFGKKNNESEGNNNDE